MTLNFDRIPLFGAAALLLSALPAICLLSDTRTFAAPRKIASSLPSIPQIEFNLPLENEFSALNLGATQDQITFSIDPPRPDSPIADSRLQVRLVQSKQIKKIEPPCRLGLQFGSGNFLQFSDSSDQFWLECTSNGYDVSAMIYYKPPEREPVCKARWTAAPMETPVRSTEEFANGSPFRELAEARFWGQDLVVDAGIQRLEIGPAASAEIADCTSNDWLVFKENRWQKIAQLEQTAGLPIAHIKSSSGYNLEIEGWEGSSHIRLMLPLAMNTPLKIKAEELFAQLRVRSEKQVSCVMDKQCLILRTGDWVTKPKDRWKILRKKEDKAAFLESKSAGELFILERIDPKNKSIAGHFFSSRRTSSIPVEASQPTKSKKDAKNGRAR